jgi:phosphoglycerate kinase
MMKTLKDIDIKPGARVLLRADFNVVLKNGRIEDDFRMLATLPTIKYLRNKRAKTIILAHLGRPDGNHDKNLSLLPIAEHLGELLKKEVSFFNNIKKAGQEIPKMKNSDIAMLENLRFDRREEEGSGEFARELAGLGDVYINDAFGAAHREHTSVYALPKLLPHAAGFLMEKETKALDDVRSAKKRPLVFVMGGAKVKTKLKTLTKLFDKLDEICLGGLLANTILYAKGVEVGKSFKEEDMREYLEKLDLTSSKLHLPVDAVVSTDVSGGKQSHITSIDNIGDNEFILDVGPDTVELFTNMVAKAGTVVWNGPLGWIEIDKYRSGTEKLAKSLKKSKADIVIGGGDIMSVIDEVSLSHYIKHQSTGGGAMLEYLAEGTMPGIKALG